MVEQEYKFARLATWTRVVGSKDAGKSGESGGCPWDGGLGSDQEGLLSGPHSSIGLDVLHEIVMKVMEPNRVATKG